MKKHKVPSRVVSKFGARKMKNVICIFWKSIIFDLLKKETDKKINKKNVFVLAAERK